MTGLAFFEEANANWAVSAYPAAALLVGKFVTTSRIRFIMFLGSTALAVNLLLSSVLVTATAIGGLGPFAPASDPLRHLRGWSDLAQMTETQIRDTGAKTVIAYNRQTAALLHWYLQDTNVNIVLPRFGPRQGNHYHRAYALSASAPSPTISADRLWAAANKHSYSCGVARADSIMMFGLAQGTDARFGSGDLISS